MPLLNEWYTQTSYAVMHHPAMTGVCMCNKFYNALLDICKIIEMFHLCAFCWFYYYSFVLLLLLFLITTLGLTLEHTQRFEQSVNGILFRG